MKIKYVVHLGLILITLKFSEALDYASVKESSQNRLDSKNVVEIGKIQKRSIFEAPPVSEIQNFEIFRASKFPKFQLERLDGSRLYDTRNYVNSNIPKRFLPSNNCLIKGSKRSGDYENEKRAPMGFVGMRGKKSSNDDFEDITDTDDFFENGDGLLLKRAPSGFVGMRGKKSFSSNGDTDDTTAY